MLSVWVHVCMCVGATYESVCARVYCLFKVLTSFYKYKTANELAMLRHQYHLNIVCEMLF